MADDFNGLKIELRRHIGERSSPLGPVKVEHDQWMVIAHTKDGMATHVGYKNKRSGSPVLYLADLEKQIGPDMAEQVGKLAELEAQKLRGESVPVEAGYSE